MPPFPDNDTTHETDTDPTMIYRTKKIDSITIEHPMGGHTALDICMELDHAKVALLISPIGGLSIDLYHRLEIEDARLMSYYLTTCANILESDQNGWPIQADSFENEDVGQQTVDGPEGKSTCQYTFSVNARLKKAHIFLNIMDPIYLSTHINLSQNQAHQLAQSLIEAMDRLKSGYVTDDWQKPATVDQ